jgi:hypothetical protein
MSMQISYRRDCTTGGLEPSRLRLIGLWILDSVRFEALSSVPRFRDELR